MPALCGGVNVNPGLAESEAVVDCEVEHVPIKPQTTSTLPTLARDTDVTQAG